MGSTGPTRSSCEVDELAGPGVPDRGPLLAGALVGDRQSGRRPDRGEKPHAPAAVPSSRSSPTTAPRRGVDDRSDGCSTSPSSHTSSTAIDSSADSAPVAARSRRGPAARQADRLLVAVEQAQRRRRPRRPRPSSPSSVADRRRPFAAGRWPAPRPSPWARPRGAARARCPRRTGRRPRPGLRAGRVVEPDDAGAVGVGRPSRMPTGSNVTWRRTPARRSHEWSW